MSKKKDPEELTLAQRADQHGREARVAFREQEQRQHKLNELHEHIVQLEQQKGFLYCTNHIKLFREGDAQTESFKPAFIGELNTEEEGWLKTILDRRIEEAYKLVLQV